MLVKSRRYREFLETGLIEILTREEFDKMFRVASVRPYELPILQWQAKSFLALLYYTGRRPSEILDIKAKDIEVKQKFLRVLFPTRKRGRATLLYVPLNDYTQYTVKLKNQIPENMFIHWYLRSNIKKVINGKTYINTTNKVSKLVKKWAQEAGIDAVAYFFRHSRFSKLAMEGVSAEDLAYMKGAKSLESIRYYLHLSSEKAMKIARKLAKE